MYITDDQNLAHNIFSAATRLESLGNHYIFEPMGLTAASLKIIGVLKHLGSASPKTIVKKLGSSKSNITQRLNFLEKKGMVKREALGGDSDKRSVQVKLTALGNKVFKHVEKGLKEHQLHMKKYFTDKELKLQSEFFRRFNLALDDCLSQTCVKPLKISSKK